MEEQNKTSSRHTVRGGEGRWVYKSRDEGRGLAGVYRWSRRANKAVRSDETTKGERRDRWRHRALYQSHAEKKRWGQEVPKDYPKPCLK